MLYHISQDAKMRYERSTTAKTGGESYVLDVDCDPSAGQLLNKAQENVWILRKQLYEIPFCHMNKFVLFFSFLQQKFWIYLFFNHIPFVMTFLNKTFLNLSLYSIIPL